VPLGDRHPAGDVERVVEGQDRAVERSGGAHAIDLPDHVVTPEELAEHIVEARDAGADARRAR
jgi:hypothetical protein